MRKLVRKAVSKLLVLLIVLIFSASIVLSGAVESNSKETATASIEEAENALVSAYQAVLDVEQSEANVSGLLAQLNEAGEFLAKAHMAYRLGDFDEATRFADMGTNIGEDVKSKAYELKDLAWRESVQRIWLTIMGSFLGVIFIALGSFLLWHFLKRRYLECA